MTYPRPQEYSEALQFPKLSILDPLLAKGTVQTDPMGLPFGRTGQFALTFKVTAKGKAYAYRCFLQQRATIHERYDAISTFLSSHPTGHFVGFTYLDNGIRVGGQTYPVVRMDWAEGQPLGLFIQDNHHDLAAMEALRTRLRVLVAELTTAGIAHGDIQSGNILVNGAGDLTLVDYDGMYIPSIAHLGAIETGHPNFQHPGRLSAQPFDAQVDAFSFALLDTALGALIEEPGLWATCKGDPDRILIGARDLANPQSSTVFSALTSLATTGQAARDLQAIAASPFSSVPGFDDFLHRRNIPQGTATATGTHSTPPSGDTPWYQAEATTSAAGARPPQDPAPSGLRIASASRPTTWPTAGTRIELVGIVRQVEHRGNQGLPSTHLTLRGGKNPVHIDIWAEGMHALMKSGVGVDQSWTGSWVSVTGVWRTEYGRTEGARHSLTVTGPEQIRRLSETRGRLLLERAGLPASQEPSPSTTAGGNADKVSGLSGQSSRPSASTASTAARPSYASSASSRQQGTYDNSFAGIAGKSWLWIMTALLIAMLVGLLLLGVVLLAAESGESSGGGGEDVPVAAAPSVEASAEPETLPMDEALCFNRNLETVACTDDAHVYTSVAQVNEADECAADQQATTARYPDTGWLCLERVAAATYETCIQPAAASISDWPRQCFTADDARNGLQWAYDVCWNGSVAGAELQQLQQGTWRKVKDLADGAYDCSSSQPKFPYGLVFTRNVDGPGTRDYRVYIPPSSGYEAVYEYLTATTREVQ